jgi:hypothetical protein
MAVDQRTDPRLEGSGGGRTYFQTETAQDPRGPISTSMRLFNTNLRVVSALASLNAKKPSNSCICRSQELLGNRQR